MATEKINGVYHVSNTEQGGGGGSDPNAVKYTPQTLTEAQQAQARENIGAGTIGLDDLENAQVLDIDAAPTEDSENLVKSGGVYEALSRVEPSIVPVDTSIPSGGLDANVHYEIGTLTGSVSITLDTTSEVSGMLNIYSLAFTAGSTAPTITWPSDITSWAGNCLDSNGAPVITAGNSYEVSIVDGMAVITEFVA